jgi:hypothetical protein
VFDLRSVVAFAVVISMIGNSGCTAFTSRTLAQSQDYELATDYYRRGLPHKALESFPKKEEGGFITSIERSWLELLSGRGDPDMLLKLADSLEARRTVRISQESISLFYQESSDGYFPGEHEAVILNLLLGTIFAKLNDREKIRVSVKRASRYLETRWDGGIAFDDPFLRIWSAALWIACDEWGYAKVDLRKALKLQPDLTGLQPVIEAPKPPAYFHVVFAGSGPNIKWEPKVGALDGPSQIRFFLSETKPNLILKSEAGQSPMLPLSVSSEQWYERHKVRNYVIRDVLADSKYMANSTVGGAGAAGVYAAGTVGNLLLANMGIAACALLIVVSIYGAGEIAKAAGSSGSGLMGALAPVVGILSGALLIVRSADNFGSNQKSVGQSSSSIVDKTSNPARYYRFVRFLPDWITASVGGGTQVSYDQGASFQVPIVSVRSAAGSTVSFFSDLADRHYEKVDKVTKSEWIDPESGRRWKFYADPASFGKAEASCKALDGFRLASVSEVKVAVRRGILDRDSPLSSELGENFEIWVTPESVIDRGLCPYTTLKAERQYVTVACKELKHGLCVSVH